jgi:hypothetical protein
MGAMQTPVAASIEAKKDEGLEDVTLRAMTKLAGKVPKGQKITSHSVTVTEVTKGPDILNLVIASGFYGHPDQPKGGSEG